MELTKLEEAALVLSLSGSGREESWARKARRSAMRKLKEDVLDCVDVRAERAKRNKDDSLSQFLLKYYLECSTPGCPGHYVRRKNRDGHTFLGCSEYPRCRNTINVDYKNTL